MRQVLKELGIDTDGIKAVDMRMVLRHHIDFKHKKTALEYFLQEKGEHAFYLPKFHCELNPIERVWGEAKRSHVDIATTVLLAWSKRLFQLWSLFNLIPLENISENIEYMQAYQDGKTGGSEVESVVKEYKSHHRVLEMLIRQYNHKFLFVAKKLLCNVSTTFIKTSHKFSAATKLIHNANS